MAGPVLPAFVKAGTNVVLATQSSMAPAITGVTLGDCLLLAISTSTNTGGRVATTVTDSAGGTWLRGPSLSNAGGGIEIWYLLNAAAGTHTLTVTMNGSCFCGCEIDEFSGVVAVGPAVDVSSTNTGTSVTPTGPSIVPANVNELIYFASFSGQAQSASPSAPFTARVGPTNSGFQFSGIAYVAPNNLIGAYAPTWTIVSAAWLVAGIALKGAQPVSPAAFNSPAAQNNGAVLAVQARPDYLDFVINGLAAQGIGVLSGCSVSPNTNADFKFQVEAGTAMLAWGPVTVAAATAQTITAADATNPRRDLVYVTQAGTVTYVAGVANATPCPPTLPVNCIPLSVIDVPANATVLDNGTGTTIAKAIDKRPMLVLPVAGNEYYKRRTGALGETIPRSQINTASNNATTGTLFCWALELGAGESIGHLATISGNAGITTPTHWWFCLLDSSLNLLAITADQTSTAWAASTEKSLAIATTKEGTATSFVTTYSGLYYFGSLQTASGSTMNFSTFTGIAAVNGLAPILAGTSNTSLTTPFTFPTTCTALTAVVGVGYAYAAA